MMETETHSRARVTKTVGGRYAVTAPTILPMMLTQAELQDLVDAAYTQGIGPRLWTDGQ